MFNEKRIDMRKLPVLLLFMMSVATFSQTLVATNYALGEVGQYTGTTFFEKVTSLDALSFTEEEKIKILEGQYLDKKYLSAQVDHYPAGAFLRYNLYDDQMEFSQDGIIFFLKKEEGRTVRFYGIQ